MMVRVAGGVNGAGRRVVLLTVAPPGNRRNAGQSSHGESMWVNGALIGGSRQWAVHGAWCVAAKIRACHLPCEQFGGLHGRRTQASDGRVGSGHS